MKISKIKTRLFLLHFHFVINEKFRAANRLLDLIRGRSITLGCYNDQDNELYLRLSDMGLQYCVSYRTGAATFYASDITKD